MTGQNGSIMGVVSPLSFAPNTSYLIGIDLFSPIINKSQYDKVLLGIGINFSL